jgi:hypothetical protein
MRGRRSNRLAQRHSGEPNRKTDLQTGTAPPPRRAAGELVVTVYDERRQGGGTRARSQ